MSISFVVPIKSKMVTGNWGHFNKLVNRTLKSICSQTNTDFNVVVVCHELPTMDFENDKIQFVQVDFPPPELGDDNKRNIELKETDKSKKVLEGIRYSKNVGAEYVMVVDSDDCISPKISSFVSENLKSKSVGWYLDKGYYYTEGKNYLIKKKTKFYGNCGSCLILRMDIAPVWVKKEPFLYYDHQTIEKGEIQLLKFPYYGAIYSMANGENHYKSWSNMKKIAKKYLLFDNGKFKPFQKLAKYRLTFLTPRLKRDFGLYKL